MNAPLILSIHGPSGEGKTFQCQHILQELKVEVFPIDSGSFESKHAGDPSKNIRDKYNDAYSFYQKCYEKSCVFINDFDLAVGNFANANTQVQYTVNTQQILATLMGLADPDIKSPVRIPIIITCNDMTKLYNPLVRVGRLRSYLWEPDINEKAKMIENIFTDLKPNECMQMVLNVDKEAKKIGLKSQPVSFYSDVASAVFDDGIWSTYQKQGHNGIAQLAPPIHITLNEIYTTALRRLQEIAHSTISYV
jgi:SpoVK/Ycf46/Vps4 family AAA+-type ATPase